ncbi:MAG: stage 0 sporulation family protein [Clostridia bacterium]|nr:MAG: stage 0 sporulation family protein [Clostridia bacterium]
MPEVIGVRFRRAGKVYYFDPGDLELVPEERVIVETSRGLECGQVVTGRRQVPEAEIVSPLKPVIRRVNPEDELQLEANAASEKEAFRICQERIAAHGLPMKLIEVECTFDLNKIIFYFSAEGRIDFRQLVRELAAIFHTRIEMRQIGVRDEAKMLGGVGCCGRELCCTTFLDEFDPVSIKMAKEQNLSLNPTKISGVCGRLMCCLRFENETYEDRSQYPRCGMGVKTPRGVGVVSGCDVMRERVTVTLEGGESVSVPLAEIQGLEGKETRG